MTLIVPTNDDDTIRDVYELHLSAERTVEIEYIERRDWEGVNEACPECQATEFDHVRYEGGHYAQQGTAVVERTDYWEQKGRLYTACKECDEILYKHPAYAVIEAWERGGFETSDTV